MYFKNCKTVEEAKKLYRQLAMKNHPDRGGNVETMQSINVEYQQLLKAFDGQTDGEHTYHYDRVKEQQVIDKIYELLALRLDGIEINLIGLWVWITGETKPHRKAFKLAGCKWHRKRECWYWHNGKKRFQSKGDLSELAKKYGVQNFVNQEMVAT
ncbi:hypothetical protein QUF74_05530 [Candidatus Halobeggiatoa sp. HSG11]|nr:hypothetical protein [Candidatus Halobeggiatoa sp. HSG11]